MSGNVQAFNYGNNLYVTEAADSVGQGQAVAISQLGNGQIRVKVLPNQDGGTSLVNGA